MIRIWCSYAHFLGFNSELLK